MKTTKKALISAIVAVIICCTMFVGSTFAWFTDQAESNLNKVVAGDLEIELRNWTGTGESDYESINEESDPLFESGTGTGVYWEPGKTEVRYLSIANVGTLDAKYSVAVEAYDISVHEDDNGNKHYFNEIMYYDIIPNAKYGSEIGWANDGTNLVEGFNTIHEATSVKLEVGAEHFFAVAIHMDENASSLYENGEITFDIKVIAGQLASKLQNDIPQAKVTMIKEHEKITPERIDMDLQVAYAFNTTETPEQALESPYANYTADFVIKADREVQPYAVALAGYYEAYCDEYNDGKWLVLGGDLTVPANTEIRLIKEMLGTGVPYWMLCEHIPEFLCGATALDDSALGTTLTVELRLYEADEEYNETENYFTIGKYEYTFDSVSTNNPFN